MRPLTFPVKTVSVTGVGSSALGSAAFAWNISEALGEPVAAIVPGYGLADIIPQALSGFFGYGLADYLRELGEQALALMAPQMAVIGRRLSRSIPERTSPIDSEGSAFRRGSPESDILHAILEHAPQITRLYGHSKGSLCIGNAIAGLHPDRAKALEVTTFSAVIQEESPARFAQILGRIDPLGQLNSWGNSPERWIERVAQHQHDAAADGPGVKADSGRTAIGPAPSAGLVSMTRMADRCSWKLRDPGSGGGECRGIGQRAGAAERPAGAQIARPVEQ